MPPKVAYWLHFSIDSVTATCLVGGCRIPLVSLGSKHDTKDKSKRLGEQQKEGIWWGDACAGTG